MEHQHRSGGEGILAIFAITEQMGSLSVRETDGVRVKLINLEFKRLEEFQ